MDRRTDRHGKKSRVAYPRDKQSMEIKLHALPFDFKMGLVFMVVLEQLDIYSVCLNVALGKGSFRVIFVICASRRNSIKTHLL